MFLFFLYILSLESSLMKFSNLRARKFHFLKHRKFFRSWTFSEKNIRNFSRRTFEVEIVKYKTFFNLRARKFHFMEYKKNVFWENIRTFLLVDIFCFLSLGLKVRQLAVESTTKLLLKHNDYKKLDGITFRNDLFLEFSLKKVCFLWFLLICKRNLDKHYF